MCFFLLTFDPDCETALIFFLIVPEVLHEPFHTFLTHINVLYCVLREMDLDEEHPHFRHYQYFQVSFDLLNYVHQPTRIGQTKRSCLDLLLIDEASRVHSCTPVPSTMETDHELVIADLVIAQPPSPPPVQPPHRNIKNINVSLFCNDLENQIKTFQHSRMGKMSIRCGSNGSCAKNLTES